MLSCEHYAIMAQIIYTALIISGVYIRFQGARSKTFLFVKLHFIVKMNCFLRKSWLLSRYLKKATHIKYISSRSHTSLPLFSLPTML